MVSVEIVKHAGDTASVVTIVSTLFSWLPPIAALFTLTWTAMRIYEMITGRAFHESGIVQYFRKKK